MKIFIEFKRINEKLKFDKNSLLIFVIFLFASAIIFSNSIGNASAATLASTPQPKFHHDNQNTGQSQYKGPQTNNTSWKYSTGNGIYSSPAIGSDGTIYIGSWDHKVYALNPNGTKKWTYTTGNEIYSSPAIGSDGTIYIGSLDHKVYALNPDGTKKWSHTTGDMIYSSPAIGSDGTIYIGSFDHKLYALNPNGTQKWNHTTGDKIFSAPAIGNDGTIYIGSFDGIVYALNPNGTQKWNHTTGDKIFSAPAIGSDGTIYIGSSDNNLYALYPDGTQEWNYTAGTYIYSSPAIGNDGTIYFGTCDGIVYALNPDGTKKWTYTTGNMIYSSPAIGSDGTIYIGSLDHNLYALNPDGTKKWTYTTGDRIVSSPVIGSDGTIYIGSYDNNLYAIADISASASVKGGYYNTAKTVTLKTNEPGTIYWKWYSSNFKTNWSLYTSSIPISNSGYIEFFAKDLAGHTSPLYTETYIIDTIPPSANASLNSGLFKTNKIVTLSMNEKGTIYYTLNSTTPTITRTKYTGPITLTSTTTLKYIAIDLAGNTSPVYTQKYTIDKIPPKVTVTKPANKKTNVSKTSSITIKFSENIKASTNINKITIKNSKGKTITLKKTLKGNTLTIKTASKSAKTWYTVTIPTGSVKDTAGNTLTKPYSFKFKTGK
ncbi:MAG: PQQ-binding-like beta-propeller repeat protein [Methanobacterium sp. ERen5]|nr:MAG: PQQ-binding-like beta-propeller repeat protein [Methanobacterium sp. ERen5]